MIDPRVALVLLGIMGTIWIGGESIKGLRWVKHHTQSAIHHVIHPHEKQVKK